MEIQGMDAEVIHQKNYRTEMKIGILTFHRAHNYGAVLQCYALQEIMKRMGHDVHVIDYRQPWIEEFYKLLSISLLRNSEGLSGKFSYLKKNLKKFLQAPLRSRHFNMFRLNFLDITMPSSDDIPQDYDIYVIGSDQLWSLHCLGGQIDEVYFGKFRHKPGSRIIGYAISADMKSVEAIESDLPFLTSGFDALSMREKAVAQKVASASGMTCDACIDPILLTDKDMWTPLINRRWKNRKYVLVYEVRRKEEDKGLLRSQAEKIASEIGGGCEVIDLSMVRHSVSDFVSLFRYASYIVTTSFHGCAFSVIFERPFYALPLWNGYDLRYKELLASLNASDRLVPKESELAPTEMDFDEIRNLLAELRRPSLSYIEKWIGK